MTSAIKVTGLVKHYGSLVAVNNISFDVKEGEIFGFLGPNGAGKTTTIRMLTGLSRPTAGRIELLGFNILLRRQGQSHRRCARSFKPLRRSHRFRKPFLHGQTFGGVPKRKMGRAEALLELFGYRKEINSLAPFRGMKRALTIAAALIHNPKILFLDEPTVGLDVMAARSLRKVSQELSYQGMTIFLTTLLEEADMLCIASQSSLKEKLSPPEIQRI